jgi:hypothetical protein
MNKLYNSINNMNNFKNKCLLALTGAVLALGACKKDKLPVIDPQPFSTAGVYVLCEGLYSVATGASSSAITYYDLATSTVEPDYFKKKNGIDLGSNANDLKQYGHKMYCVINGTEPANKDSYVEVMNIATGKSIKRIAFSDATSGFMPRYIAFYKNKAYVSSYDGYISRIDTASLSIESRLKVGGALEGLTVVNGKLYVTNSNHPIYPDPNNSSVSVIDLNTFTKLKDIPVSFNPVKIEAANNGDLYTITKGKFGNADFKPSLDKLTSVTDMKLQSSDINLVTLNITGNKGLALVDGNYVVPNVLKVFNIGAGTLGTDFIKDGTPVTDAYAVTVDALNNDVYLTDINGYAPAGKVFCFTADGKIKFEFTTDAMPQAAVFKYAYK